MNPSMNHKLRRIQRRLVGTLSFHRPQFGYWLKTLARLETRSHSPESSTNKENLFILLPGIADQHLDFEMAGFISAAEEMGLNGDLIAVDAHVGYYIRENVLERLREDVVIPSRRQGYKKIWLVGTSLGALGSALYTIQHRADVDGVFLIAPFLGDRVLIQEIRGAGGLQNWQSSFRTAKVAPFQIALWEGLKKQIYSSSKGIPIYLGYGSQDRFADSNSLLAESLPDQNVFVVSGGHNWQTWARLWKRFLKEIQTGQNFSRSKK